MSRRICCVVSSLSLFGLASACGASKSDVVTAGATSSAQASGASSTGSHASAPSTGGLGSGSTSGSASGSTTSAGASSLCSGTFVFCDDGSNAALWNDYTTRNGTWTRAAGSTTVIDGVEYQRARALLAGTYSQFDVTVMGYSMGDSGFGLLYNGTPTADDGYAVLIHPEQYQGVYLKQLVAGQADVALGSYALPAAAGGQPFTLRVQRKGTQMTVSLNGTVVLTASDNATTAQGQLGLIESTTDNTTGAGAVFTLLRVDTASDASSGTTSTSSTSGTTSTTSGGHSSTTGGTTTGGRGNTSGASTGASTTGAALGTGGLDYMVGYKLGTSVDGASAVQSWLGRPMDVIGTTINTEATPTSIYDNISPSPFYTVGGNLPLMETSFPLLSVFGEPNDLNDMAQAANGGYDATYTAMAKALAAFPNPLLSVRIAWELNGNWYLWSNGAGTNATYANYVAAFKRAAAIVKQYNPNVLIQWCLAWGQPDPTPYWPGAYDPQTNPGGVDVISMDFYQADITQYNNGGNTSSWAQAQSGVTIDLDWMVSFAQAQGVKIALSEYGAGKPGDQGIYSGPGLDDGVWTAASIAWMNSLPPGLLLWEDWSDDYPADDLSTATANPNEAHAWLSAWGQTHFAGNWWHGTPPPKD